MNFLTEMELERFFQCDGSRSFILERSVETRDFPALSWGDISEALDVLKFPHPDVHLLRGGEKVEHKSLRRAIALLQSGCHLQFAQAQKHIPSLYDFSCKLRSLLRVPVRFNLYYSPPDDQLFPRHYDVTDMFIFQIEGRKRWQVFEPKLRFPLSRHTDNNPDYPEDEVPYIDYVLNAGDVLFVPKGHTHIVSTANSSSLHITAAVFFPTALDYLSLLTASWPDNEDKRKPISPWRKNDEKERLEDILEELENLRDSELHEKLYHHLLNSEEPFELGSFPFCIDTSRQFDLDIECRLIKMPLIECQKVDTIEVRTPLQIFNLPKSYEHLWEALKEGWQKFSNLLHMIPDPQRAGAEKFLRQLARLGYIKVR